MKKNAEQGPHHEPRNAEAGNEEENSDNDSDVIKGRREPPPKKFFHADEHAAKGITNRKE